MDNIHIINAFDVMKDENNIEVFVKFVFFNYDSLCHSSIYYNKMNLFIDRNKLIFLKNLHKFKMSL